MPDNSKQRQPWQRYLAESIGTFGIVFAGCGAIITNHMTAGTVSHVGISVTFGAIVAIMIYALGPISAAHFNPAVTIGFAVARRFPWRYAPNYILAQCFGAICGGGLLYLLYPHETEPTKKFLTGQQLEQAIKVAEDTGNDLALLALMLGGWSGMNLMEICKLKQRDFDFKAGTVAVGESGAKNKYRRRVIPLPAFVQEAVKGILYRQSMVDMEGSLVNVPINLTDRIHQTISRPIHRLFKQAGLQGVCSAKDLRKTFINLAIAAGSERETLRRYVGHVPSDVMSDNYEAFAHRFPAEIVEKIIAHREKVHTDIHTTGEQKEAIGTGNAR